MEAARARHAATRRVRHASDSGHLVTEKRSGEYQFACGHTARATLDTQAPARCPVCKAATIVLRVVK